MTRCQKVSADSSLDGFRSAQILLGLSTPKFTGRAKTEGVCADQDSSLAHRTPQRRAGTVDLMKNAL
jgi:hypothetical protein